MSVPRDRPAVFRLLREESASGSSRARRELKFAVPFADPGKVRSILAANCRRVTYDQPASLVTSIYFDDDAMRSYKESVEGSGLRSKVRLRWYDSGSPVFLEVKRRQFELVAKKRVALEPTVHPEELTFREIRDGLCREIPAELREILFAHPHPTVMTQYRREYYELPGGACRITVDSELKWFDQSGRLRPNRKFGVELPRTVIIEGKTPPGEEARLRAMLYPLPLTVTRFSKYVVGCQQLGLVADTRGALS